MKKHLLFLSIMLVVFTSYGQTTTPNGNFEQWNSSSCENPQNYPTSSNAENFFRFGLPCNVTKTLDAYYGSSAVQVTTNATATDTSVGYFLNIRPNGPPNTWTGGMPYNQKPTGIRGYYKYNVATADSATILVSFSKAGVNIGSYFYSIGGIHTTYTLFNFTFSPALTQTPDEVAFGALSCKLAGGQPNGPPGSTLLLDSISFTGVASQPALMNGDFELWQNQTYTAPANWYVQSDMGEGFNKTTDAKAGNYAIELKTYMGSNQNNQPSARSGKISTGYYPNNCSGNCIEQGGYPFSNQIDTLVFYYKYTPAHPGDSASIYMNFKKNNVSVGGSMKYLLASANYQYVEIPVSLGTAPDSCIIDIESSLWQNQAVSYVGATLIIDELHFKSQPLNTGIINFKNEDAVHLFPNPTNGKITIQTLGFDIQRMEIYNILGEKVVSNNTIKQQHYEIDLSVFQKGIYYIKIYEGEKVHTQKIIKQ